MRSRIEHPWRAIAVLVGLVAGALPATARAQAPRGPAGWAPEGGPAVAARPGGERAAAEEAEEAEVSPYVARGMLLSPGQAYTTFDLRTSTAGGLETTIDAGLGLTKRLTLDGSFGTVSIGAEARYHSPQVGLWYGLVDTEPFELDATTHVTFGVGGEPTVAGVEPGAAAVLHLGDAARLDIGTYLPIWRGEGTRIGVRLPVSLAVQLGPFFNASVGSGIQVADVQEPRGVPEVPLILSVGATAPLGGGGYAVVSPSLSWPSLIGVGGPGNPAPPPMVVGASISIVTPP